MRRGQRRQAETFSLSFLDVICCGFGAVILLLIITLSLEPNTVQQISSNLKTVVAESQAAREEITSEHRDLTRELAEKRRQLAQLQARLTALAAEWERAERQLGSAQSSAEASTRVEEQLKAVRQTLSEEMRRLLSQPEVKPPDENAPIGGIPVDSEYIIFIIDTSGSMKLAAWPLVVRKMQEVLSSYPRVRGIQVLNDQGTYMFPTYTGQWIPDTPARRAAVIEQLKGWDAFSASDPAPGILQAIRTFYSPDRPASIFVFGDDFNGPNMEQVVRGVASFNRKNAAGQSQIRIHTFGFPTFLHLNVPINYDRFANMMRLLAEQNSGSFVGLNSAR